MASAQKARIRPRVAPEVELKCSYLRSAVCSFYFTLVVPHCPVIKFSAESRWGTPSMTGISTGGEQGSKLGCGPHDPPGIAPTTLPESPSACGVTQPQWHCALTTPFFMPVLAAPPPPAAMSSPVLGST